MKTIQYECDRCGEKVEIGPMLDSATDIIDAFRQLHAAWLGATHRRDMNQEMDALARIIGLDPLTLKPATEPSKVGQA